MVRVTSEVKEKVKPLLAVIEVLKKRYGFGKEYGPRNWRKFCERVLGKDAVKGRVDGEWEAPPLLTACAWCAKHGDASSSTLRDYLSIVWHWSDERVVFSLDAETERALAETALTPEDDVPAETLRRLPYRHFFIVADASPFSREFFDEVKAGADYSNFLRVVEKKGSMLGYAVDLWDTVRVLENGTEEVVPDSHLVITVVFDDGEYMPFVHCVLKLNGFRGSIYESIKEGSSWLPGSKARVNALSAVVPLQFILYLCAENAVVRERPLSPGVLSRRYKGLKVKDVLLPEEYAGRAFPGKAASVAPRGKGDGAPKRPHPRRAHWAHRWVGGRPGTPEASLALRWIPATFVHADRKDEAVVTVAVT